MDCMPNDKQGQTFYAWLMNNTDKLIYITMHTFQA